MFAPVAAAALAVAAALPVASACGRALPEELADGTLTVIVFPVLDEPFIAPNLAAGALPFRGGIEHFQGFDIDLMAGFAARHDVEVEFQRLEDPGFGALLPALMNGTGDAVASAITITPARDETVDFSRSYFEISTVVVARRDAGLRSLEDLVGKRGVGVRGSRPIEVLRDHGVDSEIAEADFQTGAYAEVIDGNADFAIMESASARGAVATRPSLEIAITLPDSEHYGIAIREGSALKPLLDRYIDDIEASGELAALAARHLGGDRE